MDNGILYRASGEEYVREAEQSARSVKKVTPDIPTCIITDEEVDSDCFDSVILKSDMDADVSSSIIRPNETPFERTLFLDTDTCVYSDITELFDVLDRYDLACTMSPSRRSLPGMSEPFREYNTGVILYNDCRKINELFECWLDRYWDLRESEGVTRNQPAFSSCAHNSNIRVLTLPPEYNCFVRSIGYLTFDTKILHGRPQSTLPDAASKLNKTKGRRIYYSRSGLLSDTVMKIHGRKRNRIDSRFFSSIRQNGLLPTLKKGLSELFATSRDALR